MKLLDVNVVLAAHRDDHPDFDTARTWLDQTIAASAPFTIVDLVAGAFLRIATNRRIFSIPTPVDDAFAYLKALRAQPAHVPLAPGPGHIALLEQLCASAEASGDLIADAQLAAIALEHACELVSFDRDFARFSELNWSRPSPRQPIAAKATNPARRHPLPRASARDGRGMANPATDRRPSAPPPSNPGPSPSSAPSVMRKRLDISATSLAIATSQLVAVTWGPIASRPCKRSRNSSPAGASHSHRGPAIAAITAGYCGDDRRASPPPRLRSYLHEGRRACRRPRRR